MKSELTRIAAALWDSGWASDCAEDWPARPTAKVVAAAAARDRDRRHDLAHRLVHLKQQLGTLPGAVGADAGRVARQRGDTRGAMDGSQTSHAYAITGHDRRGGGSAEEPDAGGPPAEAGRNAGATERGRDAPSGAIKEEKPISRTYHGATGRLRLYEEYREYMRGLYGPGPWRPDRVNAQDRWGKWCRRTMAATRR